jgi:hypothetical protein
MKMRLKRMTMGLEGESGQTLVIVAVFMGLVSVGFMAFAMDAGTLFRAQREAQSAANAAALAAVYELANGNSAALENSAGSLMAKLNGFDPNATSNPATLTLTQPTTGNFIGPYVQATVSKPISTMLMGAFTHGGTASMTVSATAIAGGGTYTPGKLYESAKVCVNGNFNVSGNSYLTAPSGIFDSSSASGSISASGSAHITASTLASASTGFTAGLYGNGDSINITPDDIVEGASISCNPALPPAPTFVAASCVADPGGSYTPNPLTFGPATATGTICYNNLTIGANGMLDNLNPGIYVINGGELHFEYGSTGHGCTNSSGCSNIGGNGVFFYLANGATLAVDNGANINIVAGASTESAAYGGGQAPDLGDYDGIAFMVPPTIPASTTGAVNFAGGSSTYMSGDLDAPASPVTINNGSGAIVNGGINAGSLEITGGVSVNIKAPWGGSIPSTPSGVIAYNVPPRLVQ